MESLADFVERGEIGHLKEILEGYGSVLVAYSGGVDSSFLLKVAYDFLGSDNVLGVTSVGPIYPESELEDARSFAELLGAPWRTVERSPLDQKEFRANSEQRCYHCKLGLFRRLKELAGDEGLKVVVEGSIADDLSDFRPGRKAVKELDIKRPLEHVGLKKREIRKLSKKVGVPFWNKPSNTCLATRIPYNAKITEHKLRQIGRAEKLLKKLGFRGFRVRHHGKLARLELRQSDLARALEKRTSITERLKDCGFTYVSLDLEGYRSGSFDED